MQVTVKSDSASGSESEKRQPKSDSTSTVELSWVLNVFLNIWYLFKKKHIY